MPAHRAGIFLVGAAIGRPFISVWAEDLDEWRSLTIQAVAFSLRQILPEK